MPLLTKILTTTSTTARTIYLSPEKAIIGSIKSHAKQ
jgi:hypothetical protein